MSFALFISFSQSLEEVGVVLAIIFGEISEGFGAIECQIPLFFGGSLLAFDIDAIMAARSLRKKRMRNWVGLGISGNGEMKTVSSNPFWGL